MGWVIDNHRLDTRAPMTKLAWFNYWTQRMHWLAWTILAVGAASAAWQASDREPPVTLISVMPAAARPGEPITIVAKVRRDKTRACAVDVSRYVLAADDAMYDMGNSTRSAQLIKDLERRSPGMLRLRFVVPLGAQPGPAELVSVLEYRCNTVHRYWPIELTTLMPFQVLP